MREHYVLCRGELRLSSFRCGLIKTMKFRNQRKFTLQLKASNPLIALLFFPWPPTVFVFPSALWQYCCQFRCLAGNTKTPFHIYRHTRHAYINSTLNPARRPELVPPLNYLAYWWVAVGRWWKNLRVGAPFCQHSSYRSGYQHPVSQVGCVMRQCRVFCFGTDTRNNS